MAKYCFSVSVEDMGNMGILPTVLGNNSELYDLDNYVYKCDGFHVLCNNLARELNIDSSQISNIRIMQVKTGLEFSIILINPYLTDALDSVKKKKIVGYENYELDTIAVSADNNMYIQMKEYLFNNLEKNSDNFFANIYTYDNKFSKLLRNYVTLYKIKSPNGDEVRELSNLKDKILKGLSIYKNYRGLCKSRYDYENRRVYTIPNTQNAINRVESVVPKTPEYDPSKTINIPLYEKNQFTNDIGEEKEEFLEFDEIEDVDDYGYGKRR